jgi:hypothetical protein
MALPIPGAQPRSSLVFHRHRSVAVAAVAFAGENLDRFFYGGDLQLAYPLANGVTPYLVAGAGAVTLTPTDATGQSNVTKLAGTGGLGLAYTLRGGGLGLFAQGTAHLYKIDSYGFDKTQADVLWTGGVSYRFGL